MDKYKIFEYSNSVATFKDSDIVWEVLNENVFNVQDKLLSMVSMSKLQGIDLSFSCRKINGKNKKLYKYKLACSINYKARLIFRIYYEPEKDKITTKVFGKHGGKDLHNKLIVINKEEELDDVILKILTNININ